MNEWSVEERDRLAQAESLLLHSVAGCSESVELGMALVGSALYVRAFRGPQSRWFQLAIESDGGKIEIGDWERRVVFEVATENDLEIEREYGRKYGSAASLVAQPAARAATLRLIPA